MQKLQLELLAEIKKNATRTDLQEINQQYHGNAHYYYGLSVPIKRAIIKAFLKKYDGISADKLSELVTELISSESYEEKTLGGYLIESASAQRMQISPLLLDKWLENLVGWAEVDTLCQSSYSAKELLDRWDIWYQILNKFVQSPNIQKRRASLVLLIKAVGQSNDNRLASQAFSNINTLQHEKHILITKAISWLLRTLIKNHRQEVEEYLTKNRELLPKIAIRETEIKLKHGIKNYRGV